MATSIIKLGLLGVSSAAALFIRFKMMQKPNHQNIEQENKPAQEIIKDTFIRVCTKQNIGLINQLYQIQCLHKEEILKPYEYTLKTGGKKIRLIMAVVVAEMFTGIFPEGKVPKEVLQVGGLIQLLHSASLIIDDIEDGSIQRRGESCSHLVFGLDRSINSANLMYFQPFRKLYESISDIKKKVQILKIFVQQMTLCHLGQAQDVMVHKVKTAEQLPSIQQYESLTIAKTSSLLRMMVKMLCVLLERSKAQSQKLCQVMNYVGLAFQVTDDVLNLTKNLGKGDMAEDLKEKKFTPIINHMRTNKQFIELFVQEKKDDQTINSMLEMIVKSEALCETKKLAQKYELMAENLIKDMKTPYSKRYFQKLMKFIITRQN